MGWNDTQRDYTKDLCLHEIIEEQVAKTPGHLALVFEGRRLTYLELNHLANRLAHLLRRKGVVPETLVGVYAERSVEMVVSLLAILKAGGAYVPLDPTYPSKRLYYMISDSATPIVLTQGKL